MGFSLLYDEIDLWWVLTHRKRLMWQGIDIKNQIYFYGNVAPGKAELLNAMDAKVITPVVAPDDYAGQYM